MLADRIFRNALIASIIFHIFIFYNWPPLRSLSIFKNYDQLELTYYPAETAPPLAKMIDKQQKLASPVPSAKKEARPERSRGNNATKADTASEEMMAKPDLSIPRIEKEDLAKYVSSGKEMLISNKDKDFSDEPSYLNYYNMVRSEIYKAANANKPYYFMAGEVRLVFVVGKDGSLLEVSLVDEGSSPNPILRRHALTSIKKASPFPPFLPTMQEDILTLRLTISFEK